MSQPRSSSRSPSTVSLSSVEAAAPIPSLPPSAAGPPQSGTTSASHPQRLSSGHNIVTSPLAPHQKGEHHQPIPAPVAAPVPIVQFSPQAGAAEVGGASYYGHGHGNTDIIRLREQELLSATNTECQNLKRLVSAKSVEVIKLQEEKDALLKAHTHNMGVIEERNADLVKEWAKTEHLTRDKDLYSERVKEANHRARVAEELVQTLRQDLQRAQLESQDVVALEQRRHEEMRVRYEQKLREKDQKLNETQDSIQKHYMSRVQDEESALQRQLRNLEAEHQAKEEAWTHRESMLSKECDSLRTTLAAERETTTLLRENVAAVEGRLTTAMRVEQTLNKRLEEARVEGSRVTNRLSEMEVSVADTQASDTRLREEYHQRVKVLSEELVEARGRVINAEQRAERERSSADELKHTHERSILDLQSRHKSTVTELESRFTLSEEREKALEVELRAYRETEESAQTENHHLRCELQKLKGDKADQMRATELAVHDTDRARDSIKGLRDEVAKLHDSLRKQQLDQDVKDRDWHTEREELQKKIHQLERQTTEAKQDWETKERNLMADLKKSDFKRAELEELQEHIEGVNVLQRMIETAHAERDRLKAQVKELQDRNLEICEQQAKISAELENDPTIMQAKRNATLIVELQDKLVVEKTRYNQLEVTLRERGTQVQWLEQELTSARPAGDLVTKLTQDKQQLEKKIDDLRRTTDLASSVDGRETLKIEQERLRRQAETLERELVKTAEERDEVRREYYDLLRKHDQVKEENSNLQKTSNYHLAQARRATDLLLDSKEKQQQQQVQMIQANPHIPHQQQTVAAAPHHHGGAQQLTDAAATMPAARYNFPVGFQQGTQTVRKQGDPHFVHTPTGKGSPTSFEQVAPEVEQMRRDNDHLAREVEELKRLQGPMRLKGTTVAAVRPLNRRGPATGRSSSSSRPRTAGGGAGVTAAPSQHVHDHTAGCQRCEVHEKQFDEKVVRRGQQGFRNYAHE